MDHSRIKNTKEYLKKIIILYKEFQNQMIDLINTIDILGKNNLKYLSMKLDYNYYYSNIEKEEEDKKNIQTLKKINEEKERRKILLDQSDNDIIYTNNNIDNNENENENNYDNNNDNDNNIHYNDDDNIHYNDDNHDNDNGHDNGSDDDYNLMNKNNFNNLNNNYVNNEIRDDDDNNRNNINNNKEININNDEDEDEIKFKNINFKNSLKIKDKKNNLKLPEEDNKIENIGDKIKQQNDLKLNNYLKQAEPNNSQNIINKKPEKTYVFKSLRNNYKPSVTNTDYNIEEKDKEKDKRKEIENDDDDINRLIYRNKKTEDNIFDKNNNYLNRFSNSNNFDDDADIYSQSNVHYTDSVKSNYIFKSKNEPKTYQREERNIPSEGGNIYEYKNNNEVDTNLNNLDIDDEDRIVTDSKPKMYTMATRAKKRRDNK